MKGIVAKPKKTIILRESGVGESAARGESGSGRPMTGRAEPAGEKRRSPRSGDTSGLSWYLEEINRIPLLTREEEDRYAREARDGNQESKNKLVQANLRFVVSIAKKYQSSGLTLLDLINEGNLGLIKASEKFDPDKGFHFISYAVWWIRQTIILAINQKSNLIRLPLNRTADLRQIDKTERYLENKLGREPTPDELADAMNLSEEDIRLIRAASRDYVSIHTPLGEREEMVLADLLEDPDTLDPDKEILRQDLRKALARGIGHLTVNERKVIQMRFGLDGAKPRSLQSIGTEFGLSKERIRQIEKKALRKLQDPAGQWNLDHFLDQAT